MKTRRPQSLLVAVVAAACASDGYGDGDSTDESSLRSASTCQSDLVEVRWIENPPVAVAGGDPVVARGEVHYDAAAAGDCDMDGWRVAVLGVEPALSLVDGVHELDGILSPGTTIPFELSLKAQKHADASSVHPANTYQVGCGADCMDQASGPVASLCVIPDGEVSLKIEDTDHDLFIDGSCQPSGACVPMPGNGVDGFGQSLYGGMFPFAGVLQPKAAGFDGRAVTERQLVPPVGDCEWTGLTGFDDQVKGPIDVYGPDVIGFHSTMIAALRAFRLGGIGCVSTVEQTMAMSCPDGVYYDYEAHPTTIAVDFNCGGGSAPGEFSVIRDGVCANRVWNPDMDGDGVVDDRISKDDKEFDGLRDNVEGHDNDPATPDLDTDGDGIPDFLDLDDDQDSLATNDELNLSLRPQDDIDGDGIPNYVDSDDDGDGLLTFAEDADGNGQPGNDDLDHDHVADAYESATADQDGDGTPDDGDADNDGDGIPTANEDPNGNGNPHDDDTDADGTPDYRNP